ncbi:hypothetical protein Cni_G17192 [Canna indica]|uniref:Uncharacterized protein n=1 Tax=Canna indica TaxID=4628 RepID=A0AAQ3KGH4_9LILI|nr:hypothetical protein Cni_G17192 [Canna indica]
MKGITSVEVALWNTRTPVSFKSSPRNLHSHRLIGIRKGRAEVVGDRSSNGGRGPRRRGLRGDAQGRRVLASLCRLLEVPTFFPRISRITAPFSVIWS